MAIFLEASGINVSCFSHDDADTLFQNVAVSVMRTKLNVLMMETREMTKMRAPKILQVTNQGSHLMLFYKIVINIYILIVLTPFTWRMIQHSSNHRECPFDQFASPFLMMCTSFCNPNR